MAPTELRNKVRETRDEDLLVADLAKLREQRAHLLDYLKKAEDVMICLAHIIEMGHLTSEGSTERYAKEVLQQAGFGHDD